MQQAEAVDAATRDADIVAMLRTGQREPAFASLVERYERRIFRLCSAMLRNSAEAEDAAQESLLRVWKSLGTFDGRAALSTWVYAVARNRCLTAIERRRNAESLSDEAVALEVDASVHSEPEVADDHSAMLRELVDELPERYRQAMRLYYYEDRSVDEVADMLATPAGTIKTNLFRARQLLATRLQQLGLGKAQYWLEAAP